MHEQTDNGSGTPLHERSIKIAADAAARAHHGHYRKNGKSPYILHPRHVAEWVEFFGGDHIGIIAAWLHDVMEDCNDGENIVLDTLGELDLPRKERDEIFAIISALTKNDEIEGKSARLADTLERINQAPPQAILIKLCSRMDNLVDARDRDQNFLSAYLPLTDQLIEALSDGAIRHGYRDALETLIELRRTFSE
jgi:(p)ppGpp synthase/HD superfamily hydrolase